MKHTILCMVGIVLVGLHAQPSAQMMMHQGGRKAVPYHGMRMMQNATQFYITAITIQSVDSHTLQIDIAFNIAIDPRSIPADSFIINGKKICLDSPLKFNKAGTMIRLIIPYEGDQQEHFVFEVPEIKSFNGLVLEQRSFDDLVCSGRFHYAHNHD